jgi:hypothetical protein
MVCGELLVAHVVREHAGRSTDDLHERHVLPNEPRRRLLAEPEQVVEDEHLTVTPNTRPDPDRGNPELAGDLAGEIPWHPL